MATGEIGFREATCQRHSRDRNRHHRCYSGQGKQLQQLQTGFAEGRIHLQTEVHIRSQLLNRNQEG